MFFLLLWLNKVGNSTTEFDTNNNNHDPAHIQLVFPYACDCFSQSNIQWAGQACPPRLFVISAHAVNLGFK
jgi:hypothetical protein